MYLNKISLLALTILLFSCTKNGENYYFEENLNKEDNNCIVSDSNFSITNSIYREDKNLYVSTYFVEKKEKIIFFDLKILNCSCKEINSEVYYNRTGEYIKVNSKKLISKYPKYIIYKTFNINKPLDELKIEVKIKSKNKTYIKKFNLITKQQYLLWQK